MVYLNNTVSAMSSFEGTSWFGIVIIVGICVVFLSLLIMTFASLEGYLRTKRWLRWIFGTINYFFIGVLTLVCLAIPTISISLFIISARKGNVMPLKVTLGLIGGYFIICLIGYLSKKFIIDRNEKFHEQEIEINKNLEAGY